MTADPECGKRRGPRAPRRSPYQGLLPYDEEDAEYFFGRDRVVRDHHRPPARIPRHGTLRAERSRQELGSTGRRRVRACARRRRELAQTGPPRSLASSRAGRRPLASVEAVREAQRRGLRPRCAHPTSGALADGRRLGRPFGGPCSSSRPVRGVLPVPPRGARAGSLHRAARGVAPTGDRRPTC